MAKWFGGKDKEGNDLSDEEAGKAVEAKFTSLEESNKKTNETLSTLSETIAAMNKRETDKQAAIDKAARDKAALELKNKNEGKTADERFEEFANNPDKYIAEQNAPAARLAMITAGKLARQETLSDKEYYTGDFKTAVDAMIEGEQNLGLRANPQFILNCYKIVLADNLEKINKGELKRNMSLQQFSDGSGSGKDKDGKDSKPQLEYRSQPGVTADKAKYAAAQLGLTEDDIIAAAKTGEIHGLEVVA